ncbi:MAG: aminoacyl-tRNA hydrolase [Candidatus Doudnabacteria bacterium]|nr:aminoacyl-tRNA hydrolase [Candidatus Doudnabacteria bacterium]
MNEIFNGVKLIVSLGNPGEKYRNNRHNVGFLALDFILNDGDGFMTAKPSHGFKSEMFTWQEGEDKVIFLKPQTYMNDSGLALKEVVNFYKLNPKEELLVIHDDVDLPLNEIRATDNSSSAGHKGVQSIIDNLGIQDFHRIRVGVESREDKNIPPTEAFVLQNFTDEEIKKLQVDVFPKIKLEIEKFLKTKN